MRETYLRSGNISHRERNACKTKGVLGRQKMGRKKGKKGIVQSLGSADDDADLINAAIAENSSIAANLHSVSEAELCKEVNVELGYVKTCWGCGVEEAEVPFKACSRCREKKLPPCFFCSDGCLSEHWPRHKTYHKAQKSLVPLLIETEKSDSAIETSRDIAHHAAANPDNGIARLILKGSLAMQQQDLRKAERMFRNVIALDPKEPAAYHNMAVVLSRSNRDAEACTYALRAVETVDILYKMVLEAPRSQQTVVINGKAVANDENARRAVLCSWAKSWCAPPPL